MLHTGDLVADFGQQRRQRCVHKDDPIVGMTDNVGQLIGRKAQIERVYNSAVTRNCEVKLQMPVTVPAESANPVAAFNAKFTRTLVV